MDFRDSPAEAEFRHRFRAWLAEQSGLGQAFDSDDEYWARQASGTARSTTPASSA